MIGEITQAILDECTAFLSGTGAQIMLKTNFLPKNLPDNNGNFILLAIDDAPLSGQYPGGLTQMDWHWSFNSYNYEPDAYVDDHSGYSTSLLNFIDTVRRHFSLGALGNGVTYSDGKLKNEVVYQVMLGNIIYNSTTLTPGTYFTATNIETFTTPTNGYVVGTSWLTQGMVTIFSRYGFQFTLTGLTAADPVDEDGIIMGYKIGFDSTALDDGTDYTECDVILDTVTQVGNPPFSPGEVIS